MATIVTRAGKGSPLTHNEVDANFENLNSDKVETSSVSAFGATLIDDADAATARTTLGLGTAATTASTDYATAAQGALADSAVQPNDSPTFGSITVTGTVDGRDVAADGTKLDGIEAGATADQTATEIKTAYESNANTNAFTDAEQSKLSGIEAGADVTDTANVTAAGALMDSELTNITAVKALDQGVATTDSPSFAGLTVNGQLGAGGANYGTSGQVLTSNGSGSAPSWQAAAGGLSTSIATFTASGTWTKPAGCAFIVVEMWGAGGGGGRGGAGDGGGGGGGGAYNMEIIPASELPATVAVTVGAGGAGATADNTAGAEGGFSRFGAANAPYVVWAYGGGGGGGLSTSNYGGGGGSTNFTGTNGDSWGAAVATAAWSYKGPEWFGEPAGDWSGTAVVSEVNASNSTSATRLVTTAGSGTNYDWVMHEVPYFGGGVGGRGNGNTSSWYTPGNTIWGGAGGAGGGDWRSGTPTQSGGSSTYGGNGGFAGGWTTPSGNGSARGGGGGGNNLSNAGSGGRGEVIVTSYF